MYGIIYCATNLINGKKYIGQTIQTLDQRRQQHLHKAQQKNYHFYNAIIKYGIDGFSWGALDEGKNQQELDSKEKYWISLFEVCDRAKGYNIREGGSRGAIAEETKVKMRKPKPYGFGERLSIAKKGKAIVSFLGSGNPRAKAIRCIETGEIFPFIQAAQDRYTFNIKNIAACCRGERKSAGGYHWEYA